MRSILDHARHASNFVSRDALADIAGLAGLCLLIYAGFTLPGLV